MTTSNHYETLGISQDATQAEVKQAYRRLVKKFHPDKKPQDSLRNHDQIARINGAYEVLGDPQHRQIYDRHLHAASLFSGSTPRRWTAEAQQRYQTQRQATQAADQPTTRQERREREAQRPRTIPRPRVFIPSVLFGADRAYE